MINSSIIERREYCVNVTMHAMHGHGRVCLKRILLRNMAH